MAADRSSPHARHALERRALRVVIVLFGTIAILDAWSDTPLAGIVVSLFAVSFAWVWRLVERGASRGR